MNNMPDCSSDRYGQCIEPTDEPSPEQFVPKGVNDGRRLYIHEDSFHDLASRGTHAATLIYSGLVALPVVKLVHHDLTEEAVAMRTISEENAIALEAAVTARWFHAITYAFHRIGVAHGRTARVGTEPLLDIGERIVATCLDSNYYTFATTNRAAERMYADVLKLSKVWEYATTEGDAYRDLTMIRGRRLALVGLDATAPRLSAPELESVKRQIMEGFAADLARILETAIRQRSTVETRTLRDFEVKCVKTVRHTILHL